MSVFVRAITYTTLFVSLMLVFVPARLLSWSGIAQPRELGLLEISGMCVSAIGAFVALWCVWSFVRMGMGTPAPFDPPRRLVVLGPYRYVRNPMYVGVLTVILGWTVLSGVLGLLIYAALVGTCFQLFIVYHEEPQLSRAFGKSYEEYRVRVGRWRPRIGRGS